MSLARSVHVSVTGPHVTGTSTPVRVSASSARNVRSALSPGVKFRRTVSCHFVPASCDTVKPPLHPVALSIAVPFTYQRPLRSCSRTSPPLKLPSGASASTYGTRTSGVMLRSGSCSPVAPSYTCVTPEPAPAVTMSANSSSGAKSRRILLFAVVIISSSSLF